MRTLLSGDLNFLERLSRIGTLAAFAVAVVAFVAAPILAITWIQNPFPGFLVEPTLVVNERDGDGWTGRQAGLGYPQHVDRIGGREVKTPAEFDAALAALSPGDQVSIFTRLPDESARLYPAVALMPFPAGDMIRLFWVPYLVGLVYLGIGTWMYRLRGGTLPGRAFSFFCFCAAIACMLLFDIQTTHAGSAAWTLAMAMTGGALVSLALRFPEEWPPIHRRPWLLAVPYGVSFALGGWGIATLDDTAFPWGYIAAWGASYRYTALGIILFIGVMLWRARAGRSSVVRLQARIVLLGSLLGFTPLTLWFVAPLLGAPLPFDTLLLLPGLVIFPAAVTVAIIRHRLLEVEVIVNRTIFYGALTAVLTAVYTVSISISQKLFTGLTGERSDAAIVITTLFIVSVFVPLKTRMQAVIDTRFKEAPDNTRVLSRFGAEVYAFFQMSDAQQITRRLLEEAARSLQAESGAFARVNGSGLETVHTYGRWTGDARICLPLEYNGTRYGLLSLGPRHSQKQYTRRECETLEQTVSRVAQVVHWSHLAFPSANDRGAEPGGNGHRP